MYKTIPSGTWSNNNYIVNKKNNNMVGTQITLRTITANSQ